MAMLPASDSQMSAHPEWGVEWHKAWDSPPSVFPTPRLDLEQKTAHTVTSDSHFVSP